MNSTIHSLACSWNTSLVAILSSRDLPRETSKKWCSKDATWAGGLHSVLHRISVLTCLIIIAIHTWTSCTRSWVVLLVKLILQRNYWHNAWLKPFCSCEGFASNWVWWFSVSALIWVRLTSSTPWGLDSTLYSLHVSLFISTYELNQCLQREGSLSNGLHIQGYRACTWGKILSSFFENIRVFRSKDSVLTWSQRVLIISYSGGHGYSFYILLT